MRVRQATGREDKKRGGTIYPYSYSYLPPIYILSPFQKVKQAIVPPRFLSYLPPPPPFKELELNVCVRCVVLWCVYASCCACTCLCVMCCVHTFLRIIRAGLAQKNCCQRQAFGYLSLFIPSYGQKRKGRYLSFSLNS